MYSMLHKKTTIVSILNILKQYTDENHRLSQKEIAEILEREYGMRVDRKAIKRNLSNLIDAGYDIECSQTTRMIKNKDGSLTESTILSDFYLERDFTDAELRLLIDSLLFSKHIPHSQCKELINKIEGLSSRYFRSSMRHVCCMPENTPKNGEIFYTIEVLGEAINNERQVAFKYNDWGTDKKLHPRKDDDGNEREYIINPYQMVATNGRYYLICNYDKYDNAANYRIDRITDIRMLDTPVKPMKKVSGFECGLDLPKHMAEHIYMFSDETKRVTFTAQKCIISEIMDWFGNDVRFVDETADEVTAEVRVSCTAMKFWAMQYAEYVTVTYPESLADEVGCALRNAAKKYNK